MGNEGTARQSRLRQPPPAEACRLTRRETEVVQLAANGRNTSQIGRELGLSVRTVEDHLARARRRTGAATTAELVARVVAAGIVFPGAIPAAPGDRRRRGGTARAEYAIMFRKSNISEHDYRASCGPTGNERGKRGRPTVMTPDRINAAAEMLSSHSVIQIARKLGVSRGTVYAHMPAIQAARLSKCLINRQIRPGGGP
jgi:DNA-binding CsgD family transcriptional regulator